MASPSRPKAEVPGAVIKLCETFPVCKEARSLARLPEKIILDMCSKAALTLDEIIEVQLFIGAVHAERKSVAEVQEEAAALRIYPWKETERRSMLQGDRFHNSYTTAVDAHTDPFDALRTMFEANATAGLVSAESCLVLNYLLYGSDEKYSRYYLASLLLLCPPAQRLATHNWQLAQQLDTGLKHAIGEAIQKLKTPLWPPGAKGAETLNAKLLRGVEVQGGSSEEASLYANETLIPQDPEAAGVLPVQQQNNGTYAVDTTALEQSFGSEITALRNDIAHLRNYRRTRIRTRIWTRERLAGTTTTLRR